jgi:WD40 repeat protein
MVHCWRAHNGIVAEVTYVGHEFCPLLVSGSDDGSVRLWNMKGHFIGTFGQVFNLFMEKNMHVLNVACGC